MTAPQFPLTVPEPGGRADAVISAALEGVTRSAAQRWLEEGRVTQNGIPLKKNAKLRSGDRLLIAPPQPEPLDLIPQDIPLCVAYEDNEVIVVDKPVGMVVHPAPGHPDGTLVNALLYHCKNSLSGINGQLRPGIVHRIDPPGPGRPAPGPLPVPPVSCRGSGRPPGGLRHGKRPHRPPSHGPQAHGGVPSRRGPGSRHPLAAY